MHKNNVLHRDIKSNNILFSADGEVKITDMGYACALSNKRKKRDTKLGTMHWVAPEIMQGLHYSIAVDIYSFGCFAYELATGLPPFSNIQDSKTLRNSIIKVNVPEIPGNWSANFKSFVKMCLKKNPSERWTIN